MEEAAAKMGEGRGSRSRKGDTTMMKGRLGERAVQQEQEGEALLAESSRVSRLSRRDCYDDRGLHTSLRRTVCI